MKGHGFTDKIGVGGDWSVQGGGSGEVGRKVSELGRSCYSSLVWEERIGCFFVEKSYRVILTI